MWHNLPGQALANVILQDSVDQAESGKVPLLTGGPNMVAPSNLDSLTKRCTEVLGRYIRQAERAYALLGAIKRHPVSEEERQQLRAQRTNESLAFVEYHEVRERLIKLAEWI